MSFREKLEKPLKNRNSVPKNRNQKDDDQFLLLPQVLYSFTNGGTELREK